MATRTKSSPVLYDDPGVDDETKRRVDEILAPDIWRATKKTPPTLYKNSTKIFVSEFSTNLFWEISSLKLDLEKNKSYIIDRVLDHGDMDDWNLIKKIYTVDGIIEVALKLRSLSPLNLAFISCIADIPKEEFRCYKWKQLIQRPWDC